MPAGFARFRIKEIAAVANEDIVSEFSTKTRRLDLKYSLDTASASMYIIHLLCCVAGSDSVTRVNVLTLVTIFGDSTRVKLSTE